MQKYTINKLDENFDVDTLVGQYSTYEQALAHIMTIEENGDYVLVGIDSDGNEHLLLFR
ncbi:MAG: hypothetical protein IJE50_04130 [Clostridia bacterium]|nr:hypothetical protein [Clostridia bacterium]